MTEPVVLLVKLNGELTNDQIDRIYNWLMSQPGVEGAMPITVNLSDLDAQLADFALIRPHKPSTPPQE